MPTVTYAGTPVHFTGAYSGSYDCINRGQFYELPLLEYIRTLGLGGTYLDIGTNIGNHALFFALFCQSDRVIGFEPMPNWRARALDNIAANDCGNKIEVFPLGLLDEPKKIEFNPYGTSFTLDCCTLDELLPDVTGVSVVKMDIEGSEPQALLGGRQFFRRNRPIILAECLEDTRELEEAARVIGYRLAQRLPVAGSPMFELRPEDARLVR
jgi:FkbM family methyltransferase